MMTLVTKDEFPPDAPIVARVGESWCVAIEGSEPIPGCSRLPLPVFRDFMWRDSTVWHTPDNAAEGRVAVDSMINSWLESLADIESVTPVSNTSLQSHSKRKSILDAQRERARHR